MIIEADHYERLTELFDQFAEVEFGKAKLLQLRGERDRLNGLEQEEIRYVIDNNRQMRESFNTLVGEIKSQFGGQLRGDTWNSPNNRLENDRPKRELKIIETVVRQNPFRDEI